MKTRTERCMSAQHARPSHHLSRATISVLKSFFPAQREICPETLSPRQRPQGPPPRTPSNKKSTSEPRQHTRRKQIIVTACSSPPPPSPLPQPLPDLSTSPKAFGVSLPLDDRSSSTIASFRNAAKKHDGTSSLPEKKNSKTNSTQHV